MGRKIKRAAAIAAAGMLVGIQAVDLAPVGVEAQARPKRYEKSYQTDQKIEEWQEPDGEKEEEGEKEEKEEEKEGEKKEEEKGETEPDENEKGETEPDENEKEEEKDPEQEEKEEIKLYRTEYNEPDGQNGYYVHSPEGKIVHRSKRGSTRFYFENGNGERREGILEKENSEYRFRNLDFAEGRNYLEIWMEDEENTLVDHSEKRMEFWIDSVEPVVELEVSGGADLWHKEEAELTVHADDGSSGSQIAEILCKTGEKVIGKGNKATEKFLVEEKSDNGESIPVTVIVKDYAGNQRTITENVFVDGKNPEVEIAGIQDYMITSHPVQIHYRTTEENAFDTVQADVKREAVNGQTEESKVTEWKSAREETSGKLQKESTQLLSEDGIYKLQMTATDQAGHESKEEKQLIIDKENPVIAQVEELNGKYMKYFRWDRSIDEVIKDFTSYTYTIKVDDSFYQMGETIDQEGGHLLVVQAVDSAGNTGEARAGFVIDHTPPVIQFENVKEGESYEKERKLYVRTENPEDQIEYVKINGKKQKGKKQKDAYEIVVNEPKEYEIEVKAKDLAGNETVSRIGFLIEPEKTILQKALAPVRKYIFPGKGGKKETTARNSVKEKRTTGWQFISLAVVLTGTGVGIWKKESWKESHKREDAG